MATTTSAQYYSGIGQLLLNGGSGNDVIFGSARRHDFGGDGFDSSMRYGDDSCARHGRRRFVWNGDGSDVVDGQLGNDTLLFNGSGANETIRSLGGRSRARLERDVDTS